MKLTIFAATGGIGRRPYRRLPDACWPPTSRRPTRRTSCRRVAGADAVLSTLGGRSRDDTGVATHGTEAMIAAMRVTGVTRVIIVSTAPIGTVPSPARPHPPRHDPGDNGLMRYVLGPAVKRVLRGHYADLARMEDALRASALDWTIMRPPRLTDGPLTRIYRTAHGQNLRGGTSVSRADVADYMLRAARDHADVQQIVGIAQ